MRPGITWHLTAFAHCVWVDATSILTSRPLHSASRNCCLYLAIPQQGWHLAEVGVLPGQHRTLGHSLSSPSQPPKFYHSCMIKLVNGALKLRGPLSHCPQLALPSSANSEPTGRIRSTCNWGERLRRQRGPHWVSWHKEQYKGRWLQRLLDAQADPWLQTKMYNAWVIQMGVLLSMWCRGSGMQLQRL